MDGEFEWAPCSSATNAAPPYNEVVYEEGTWTEKKTGWCCDEVDDPIWLHTSVLTRAVDDAFECIWEEEG